MKKTNIESNIAIESHVGSISANNERPSNAAYIPKISNTTATPIVLQFYI